MYIRIRCWTDGCKVIEVYIWLFSFWISSSSPPVETKYAFWSRQVVTCWIILCSACLWWLLWVVWKMCLSGKNVLLELDRLDSVLYKFILFLHIICNIWQHRCWWQVDVDDFHSILVTSFGCWWRKRPNPSKLSLTHLVSNIGHQHRCSPYILFVIYHF